MAYPGREPGPRSKVPEWDASDRDRWRYSLGRFSLDEDASPWPNEWSFNVTVEFPPSDLREVTKRVQRFQRVRAAVSGSCQTTSELV